MSEQVLPARQRLLVRGERLVGLRCCAILVPMAFLVWPMYFLQQTPHCKRYTDLLEVQLTTMASSSGRARGLPKLMWTKLGQVGQTGLSHRCVLVGRTSSLMAHLAGSIGFEIRLGMLFANGGGTALLVLRKCSPAVLGRNLLFSDLSFRLGEESAVWVGLSHELFIESYLDGYRCFG